MDSFEIRPMTARDTAEIADIETKCFSSPWKYEDLLYHSNNGNSHFLTAVSGNKTAGYIGVTETAGEAYIMNIAVLPEFRRQGIARALLNKAIEGARERNCEFITLEVRESNLPAISLYESSGFVKGGKRKNFYSAPAEDAILYTVYFKE